MNILGKLLLLTTMIASVALIGQTTNRPLVQFQFEGQSDTVYLSHWSDASGEHAAIRTATRVIASEGEKIDGVYIAAIMNDARVATSDQGVLAFEAAYSKSEREAQMGVALIGVFAARITRFNNALDIRATLIATPILKPVDFTLSPDGQALIIKGLEIPTVERHQDIIKIGQPVPALPPLSTTVSQQTPTSTPVQAPTSAQTLQQQAQPQQAQPNQAQAQQNVTTCPPGTVKKPAAHVPTKLQNLLNKATGQLSNKAGIDLDPNAPSQVLKNAQQGPACIPISQPNAKPANQ